MSDTTALRDEIKKTFFPFAAEKGFSRSKGSSLFYTFRKITPEGGYVFDIQFEKYHRPRFVVNLGSCGPAGVDFAGRKVAISDMQPSDTANFARLKPRTGGSTRSWFCQDRGLLKSLLTFRRLDDPAVTVASFIGLFGEAEDYLYNNVKGPHIFSLRFAT
ncbi:MAG: hypothetical protein EPN97_05670 [Alphaproteobacteria bacterium]|nr:MAG: hypothetical protein EPN97_05670 [Alphaproteobacteria bacterium]